MEGNRSSTTPKNFAVICAIQNVNVEIQDSGNVWNI